MVSYILELVHVPRLVIDKDFLSCPANVRVGSQPEVSDSHENVCFRR